MADKRTTLSDVINYAPETYLKQEELELIQSTFKGNDKLIKVLRKIMLPSVGDADMPIEEVGKDMWLGMDFTSFEADEVKPIVLARQDAIKFIIGGLIQLKIIANGAVESPMNAQLRKEMDSTQ